MRGDNAEFDRKTFGNSYEGQSRKVRVVITNPEGSVTLKPFDDQKRRLNLVISLFPDVLPKNSRDVFRVLAKIRMLHNECPPDQNFWAWYVSIRQGRVSTLHHEFLVMFQYLQMGGYYSKTFKPMLFNFRLKQRDGVRRGDLILTEGEIAHLLRKEYKLDTADNRAKQKALDTFVLALFTGARYADVRTIVKSVDALGNPILLYHNRKGTRSQSVAWNPAVEGALQRKMYVTQGKSTIMCSALKAALYEALPPSSNRLISYYYLRPGQGRQLFTDSRISHITYHAARHTFCTRLLRIGISPAIVAQLAGHKNIQTTMKYYNWTKEQEANDILRDVYGTKSLISEKPAWGEDASGLTPLPVAIHAAQLPQPQFGAPVRDDGGVVAKFNAVRQTLIREFKPSAKELRIINEVKRRGLV